MLRRRSLAAAVIPGLALSTMLGVAPSYADIGRFDDARGETGQSIDVWHVRIDNSTTSRNRVTVTVQFDQWFREDRVNVFLDTKPRNSGPEYAFTSQNRRFRIWRVPGWRPRNGRAIACQGVRASAFRRSDRVRISFLRRCLGRPQAVRVSAMTRSFVPEFGFFTDWAPGRHRFTPWVRR
jgi:hypothetical protein